MKNLMALLLILAVFCFTACDNDDDNQPATSELVLSIAGLEDLGSDYAYEGWLIVDGSPVSAGIFNVDADGNLSQQRFELNSEDLNNATAYVLTIEPSPDNDPNPSSVHILAGDFSGNTSLITVGHSAAIGTDFINSGGSYILATPTDGGSDTDELSGVWWLDPAAGPGASLELPQLPAGWKYEGWAVVEGIPVSTGKFTAAEGADSDDSFSSNLAAGPPFPGEDLLTNAPEGLFFPTDLSGEAVVISVEPDPDNSTAPFLLKPLIGQVPMGATDHTSYEMDNNAAGTNPTGMVSR